MNGQCELFIYKNCKILKNKNFKVDDIQTYLSTLEPMNRVENGSPVAILGQWMKHQLKTKYVIEVSQTQLAGLGSSLARRVQDLASFEDNFNYNYLVAQNIDHYYVGTSPRVFRATKVYYFITGKRWMGENAIELELEMDVINTMIDNYNSGEQHLELSEKTTILREHKNRWTYTGTELFPNYYKPKIDRYGEGISVPTYKVDEASLVESAYIFGVYEPINLQFYLIYRARENPEEHSDAPIDILMCADEPIYVRGGTAGYSGSRDPRSEIGTDDWWFVYGGDGNNVGMKLSFTDKDGEQTIELTRTDQCISITRFKIQLLTLHTSGQATIEKTFKPKGFRKFTSVFFENVFVVREGYITFPWTISKVQSVPVDTSFTPPTQNVKIGSIYELDRTDPKLLKVISLPYRPISVEWGFITESAGQQRYSITMPSGWGVLAGSPTLMRYQSSNLIDCFSSEYFRLRTPSNLFYNPFDVIGETEIYNFGNKSVKRNIKFETKLFHSDFYNIKFVYDSFVYTFRLENIHIRSYAPFGLRFLVSSTMNSKMVFKFDGMDFVGLNGENGLLIDDQDYSNMVYIARNNELPIFNSAFLNYIRTGFNYDVKTKNRQLRSNIISSTIQIAGAVASGVSSVATGGFGVAGAIALGTSAVSSIYRTIEQTAQAEQNIAQKLKSTEMQGLSVIGSDDVDLMADYTENNKAKNVIFEVSPKMKKCLFDLFYYCGYIGNYQGIPRTNTRMWFNFVMAEPVYKNEQNLSQELVEELSKKYREGITFLHKVEVEENNETISKWDFEQEMENWETNLQIDPRLVYIETPTSLKGKVEYVIRDNLSYDFPTALGRVSNSGKLTWRKRSKTDLSILEELTGLDSFVFNPDINTYKMDVRIGSTIKKEVSIDDYERADFYWTIEFSQDTSSGYQQENVYNVINGKIVYN